MGQRMQGKVVVVTGAGSIGPGWGNGKASAVLLAREGGQVFAVDKTLASAQVTQELIEGEGGRCIAYEADVTDAQAVEHMVNRCCSEFGSIDVLYNNVGAAVAGGITDLDEAAWDAQIEVNLKHVFLVTRTVIGAMLNDSGGSIINVGSTSGLTFTGQQQIAYQTAKAAISRFSQSVALEFAPVGIRCNTVIPGQMDTPMVQTYLAGQQTGGDVEALVAKRNARIPMGFMGNAWDVANAVLFLASDEARYITGAQIVVDGGMTLKCTNE